jgi:hypothetical protein
MRTEKIYLQRLELGDQPIDNLIEQAQRDILHAGIITRCRGVANRADPLLMLGNPVGWVEERAPPFLRDFCGGAR